MHTEEIFIKKKFILTNELTRQTDQIQVNVVYLPEKRQINLKKALQKINSQRINLNNSQIFYTDFQKRMNVFIGQMPFQQQILLKNQLFYGDFIQINYRIINPINSSNSITTPIQPKIKKVKQRSIKQAIDSVKKWRELYEEIDEKGKRKYTLETAAQQVGYAKKTLDDYFNQLRLAQSYNFDFNKHSYDKIGVLRKFVKERQQQQMTYKYHKSESQQLSMNDRMQQQIDKYLGDSFSSDDDSIY